MKPQRKIMLVEDDREVLDALAEILRQRGFWVEPFDSARLALQTGDLGRYDAAVIDLKMPGVDGYSLIRTLRSLSVKLFLVAITGLSDPDCREKALQSGADCFFRKPLIKKEMFFLALECLVAPDAGQSAV